MIPDIVEIKRLCASGQWIAKVDNGKILLHDTVAGETVCIGNMETEPVRHGEWKWVFNRKADTWGDDCYESGWECSECGAGADIYTSHHKVEESCEESEKGITDERTIYCHNCGAKMRCSDETE